MEKKIVTIFGCIFLFCILAVPVHGNDSMPYHGIRIQKTPFAMYKESVSLLNQFTNYLKQKINTQTAKYPTNHSTKFLKIFTLEIYNATITDLEFTFQYITSADYDLSNIPQIGSLFKIYSSEKIFIIQMNLNWKLVWHFFNHEYSIIEGDGEIYAESCLLNFTQLIYLNGTISTTPLIVWNISDYLFSGFPNTHKWHIRLARLTSDYFNSKISGWICDFNSVLNEYYNQAYYNFSTDYGSEVENSIGLIMINSTTQNSQILSYKGNTEIYFAADTSVCAVWSTTCAYLHFLQTEIDDELIEEKYDYTICYNNDIVAQLLDTLGELLYFSKTYSQSDLKDFKTFSLTIEYFGSVYPEILDEYPLNEGLSSSCSLFPFNTPVKYNETEHLLYIPLLCTVMNTDGVDFFLEFKFEAVTPITIVLEDNMMNAVLSDPHLNTFSIYPYYLTHQAQVSFYEALEEIVTSIKGLKLFSPQLNLPQFPTSTCKRQIIQDNYFCLSYEYS